MRIAWLIVDISSVADMHCAAGKFRFAKTFARPGLVAHSVPRRSRHARVQAVPTAQAVATVAPPAVPELEGLGIFRLQYDISNVSCASAVLRPFRFARLHQPPCGANRRVRVIR